MARRADPIPKKTALSPSHQTAGCQMPSAVRVVAPLDQEARCGEGRDDQQDHRDVHGRPVSSVCGAEAARAALAALAASLACPCGSREDSSA